MDIRELPPFLNEANPERILEEILNQYPSQIDRSEGQHAFNIAAPIAQLIAQYGQMYTTELLLRSNPLTARDEFLDVKLAEYGEERIKASNASGTVQVELRPDTVIPAGSIVAIEGDENSEPIYYSTRTQQISDNTGVAFITVYANEPGTGGNAPEGKVTTWVSPPNLGISEINNITPMSGGVDRETSEAFRQRFLNRAKSRETAGNIAMYQNAVEGIAGVGRAIVQRARYGPGSVGISVVGSNGQPAGRETLDRVQDVIAEPYRLTIVGQSQEVASEYIYPIDIETFGNVGPAEAFWFLSASIQSDEPINCLVTIRESITSKIAYNNPDKDELSEYHISNAGVTEFHFIADKDKNYEVHIKNNGDENILVNPLMLQSVFEQQDHSGLASVEHRVYIESADGTPITIRVRPSLASYVDVEAIKASVTANITSYLEDVIASGSNVIRYNMVGKQVLLVHGIEDYEELMINGQKNNLTFQNQQIPVLSEVVFDE
ncbi:hypothetical protein DH09_08165 [Bacillaceae bacterium JMAK1]|nr:hypothetical protein DH09_08165 [Bacillaceae bacterium JMAK1]